MCGERVPFTNKMHLLHRKSVSGWCSMSMRYAQSLEENRRHSKTEGKTVVLRNVTELYSSAISTFTFS